MSTSSIREKNMDALRRFFKDDFHSAERRSLWAKDALFEMPWELGGPVAIRGRDAIMAESDEWWTRLEANRFYDLVIFETSDPDVFWVTVKSETVEKSTHATRITDFVNYFRLRDGEVAHRIEYFNPSAHPR